MLSQNPQPIAVNENGLVLCPVNDFTIFTGFSCGDTDLNDFIVNDAHAHASELVALSYALYLVDGKQLSPPLAFVSLLNDSVKIPRRVKQKIPRSCHYPTYPAVKIGRIGVRTEMQHKGLGHVLIAMVIDALTRNRLTGCRLLTLDAYLCATHFYQRCGFQFLTQEDANEKTRLMFLDLARVR